MVKIKKFINQEALGWKMWEKFWILFASIIIVVLSVYWGDNARGIIAATTGVICVVLTGKGKMSCYIFGLINTILYAWISFEARYFGEVMLNALYYVPMQFVGWFMWKKHMDQETNSKLLLTDEKEISRCTKLAKAINDITDWDLVLFLEPTVEFIQDGTRNETIAADREKYSNQIKKILNTEGVKLFCVDGDYLERFNKAKQLIHDYLKIDTKW